ncbi:hypothetical protein [Hyphococcus sp.]
MKPASIMSPSEKQSIALQNLQPEYARSRADEAAEEGFVLMR